MDSPEVVLLMGSTSDWPHLKGAVATLSALGVPCRVHVTSAHRTPERTRTLVAAAERDGCRVFICAAGMAAHLAGTVAALTLRPVLGVPMPGGILDGVDALLSTVQMPPGVPVATFGIGAAGAKNAAIFAAELLAGERPEVGERLRDLRDRAEAEVGAREQELRARIEEERE